MAKDSKPESPNPPQPTAAISDDELAAAERAKRRRDWPIRSYTLGTEPGEDLSATTTAEERLAMMWPLALEAWALTGRPMPEYTRATMPVRVLDFPVKDASDG